MEREQFLMLKEALREILVEEGVWQSPPLGHRWAGGKVVFVPSTGDKQEKEVPLEVFFKKIIAVRDKLRVLEQKINNHPKLDGTDRLDLHQYITRAYGSLTTFNFLFQDKDDYFIGEGKRRGSE